MSNVIKFVVKDEQLSLDKIIQEKDVEKLYYYIENEILSEEEVDKIIEFAINDVNILYYIIANFDFDKKNILDLIIKNRYFNYISDFIIVEELRNKFDNEQIDYMFNFLIENNFISREMINSCKKNDLYKDKLIDYLFKHEDFDTLHLFMLRDKTFFSNENRLKLVNELIKNKNERNIKLLQNFVVSSVFLLDDELKKKIIEFFIGEKRLKELFLFIYFDVVKDEQQKEMIRSLIYNELNKN